jgi:RecA-family ATPase
VTNTIHSSIEKSTPFFDFAQTNQLALVCVHKGAKNPVGDDWPNLWSKDRAVWEQWHREGFNIGIHAGASGLVTFDLDSKHGGIEAVRARFGEWFIALGVGRLPHHVETPSGGQHILMRLPVGTDPKTLKSHTRGTIVGKGVDVLVGNKQSVAPGSYFDGTAEGKPSGHYTFHAAPIYAVPPSVVDLLSRTLAHEAAPAAEQPRTPRIGLEDFDYAEMEDHCTFLATVDGYLANEFNWVTAVWALRRAFGDRGWPLAEMISYRDHKNRLDGVWEREDANVKNPSTCATLIKESNKVGYREWKKEHMFDEILDKENGTWSPPLAPDLPPLPLPLVCSDEHDEAPDVLRSRRINAASLEGKPVPVREWLIRDLIPAKNVTLLYGDGGTGKSLLALQAAAAVVLGGSFFGHLVATRGRVEFITAEDSLDEMHRRLVDIARFLSVSLGGLDGLHLTSLAEADALLAVPQDNRGGALAETALYNELNVLLAESSPAVLFLDTLADVYGGNEVVRAQARQFIGMLRRLALHHDCTVVVLAHPSLAGMDKGTSGSTAWNNSVRSRLYLNRVREDDGSEIDEDLRTLRVQKSNYGRVGDETQLRWRDGVFVNVHPTGSGDPLVASARADRVFISLLTKYADQGQSVGPSPGANYAPKVFESEARPHGVNKRALIAAMQRLLDTNRIWIKTEGPRSRPTRQLAVMSTDNSTSSNASPNPSNTPSNGLQTPSHTPPYNPPSV